MRLWTVMIGVTLAGGVKADEPLWKLAYEDEFDRAEIGDQWIVQGGNPKIVDGRLFFDNGGTLMLDRSLVPDVKMTFEAEANPGAPPCDLSVGLGCGRLGSYSYLLQFGGRNNSANAIYGGNAGVSDLSPSLLIEHGKRYKLEAVKEGNRLAYYVNGTKIIENADVPDPVGGPGFDRVSLVTWHGMYVDHVKVYERTQPAPGAPEILMKMPDFGWRWDNRTLRFEGGVEGGIGKVLDAYNARRFDDALTILRKMAAYKPGPGETIAPSMDVPVMMTYVVGDLAYDETQEVQRELADLAEAAAKKLPDDPKARDFALAARWFSNINIYTRDRRACTRLTQVGLQNNPFYYKAKLFQARFHLAGAQEGAHQQGIADAIDMFRELKATWPEHQALRELTGESIPWGEELIRGESDGPAWARYLQETLARHQKILEYWMTERQLPDGQLGGGWGDDVEILRGWVPATCITTACETAVAGIERLAQGVWDKVLKDGYDDTVGDVEHSAEPSADSLPTMILLRYGDPRWVEYNLQSAKTIRERFMAVNDRGFLQFMSTEFGSKGVNRSPGGGGDTGYHARALKHHIWLAWYGIPEAHDVFLGWCDTWRDATMRRIGTKPPGFSPSSIFYPSGGIDPPMGKPWTDDRSHYYGFPGLPTMVHDSFLTAYLLSGDRKFLVPVETMMELSTLGPLHKGNPKLAPDDVENLLTSIAHVSSPEITSVYRWLTGERVYDEYTLRRCTATQRYRVHYDLDAYAASFEHLAKSLRSNWTRYTSEVLQTDRAGLAGANEVLGAYTGAVRDVRDAGAPTMAVTWDTPDLDFAAVVTETAVTRLRVMLYSFHDGPTRMGLRPWRLTPGRYVLNAGEPVSGEYSVQHRYTWGEPRELEHLNKGEPIWIDVPPHREWVVDIRLVEAIERPKWLPDLAIAARDIAVAGDKVKVTVHNIGGAAAGAFDVAVQERKGDAWSDVSRQRVEGLPAIKSFDPVRHDVTLTVSADAVRNGARVVLDPGGEVDELYEPNNTAPLAPDGSAKISAR